MYTFSSKLKTFSFVLMIVGILGIGYGFFTAPKTIQDVETILKEEEEAHHGGHEATAAHEEAKAESHESEAKHEEVAKTVVDSSVATHEAAVATHDTIAKDTAAVAAVTAEAHAEEGAEHAEKAEAHGDEHAEHLAHVFHQLQNKPWAALYVACIFFMLITMGALAFYGIQQVAQAGWSPVLFRVMQGITAYLPVGSLIFFVLLIITGLYIASR